MISNFPKPTVFLVGKVGVYELNPDSNLAILVFKKSDFLKKLFFEGSAKKKAWNEFGILGLDF